MRSIGGIVAAWIVATVVAIAIAATAVAGVRSEVTDTPTALGTPEIGVDVVALESAEDSSTTSVMPTVPATTTTMLPPDDVAVVTTTVVPVESPTTTIAASTVTPEPSTTTTVGTTSTTVDGSTKTYDTEGGSVRIVVSGDAVTFAGATPLPGWKVELENSGPEEVNVHFERNEDEEEEIEFKAKVEDGELKVSISEDD